MLAALVFAFDRPLIAAGFAGVAVVGTLAEGAFRNSVALDSELAAHKAQLRALEATQPELGVGRVVLPPSSQPIHVFMPERGGQPQSVGTGRVLRVPVSNRQGAATARCVHARVEFLPNDRHRSFAPRDPAQCEWVGQTGPELEIDLPGNGRERFLDVLLVLDGDYPHAYEWTEASRHAALRGYAIKASPIEIAIEVLSANAAPIRETLIVDLRNGKLAANWDHADACTPTNWVPWAGSA